MSAPAYAPAPKVERIHAFTQVDLICMNPHAQCDPTCIFHSRTEYCLPRDREQKAQFDSQRRITS